MYKAQVIERIVKIETEAKILKALYTENLKNETKIARDTTEAMVLNMLERLASNIEEFRKEYEQSSKEKVSEVCVSIPELPAEKTFVRSIKIGMRGGISMLEHMHGIGKLREVKDDATKTVKYYVDENGKVEHIATYIKQKAKLYYSESGELI